MHLMIYKWLNTKDAHRSEALSMQQDAHRTRVLNILSIKWTECKCLNNY